MYEQTWEALDELKLQILKEVLMELSKLQIFQNLDKIYGPYTLKKVQLFYIKGSQYILLEDNQSNWF